MGVTAFLMAHRGRIVLDSHLSAERSEVGSERVQRATPPNFEPRSEMPGEACWNGPCQHGCCNHVSSVGVFAPQVRTPSPFGKIRDFRAPMFMSK